MMQAVGSLWQDDNVLMQPIIYNSNYICLKHSLSHLLSTMFNKVCLSQRETSEHLSDYDPNQGIRHYNEAQPPK